MLTFQVDFVGIMKSGDFDDRDNEGHRGATIRTIGTLSGVGIAAAPNVRITFTQLMDVAFAVSFNLSLVKFLTLY